MSSTPLLGTSESAARLQRAYAGAEVPQVGPALSLTISNAARATAGIDGTMYAPISKMIHKHAEIPNNDLSQYGRRQSTSLNPLNKRGKNQARVLTFLYKLHLKYPNS